MPRISVTVDGVTYEEDVEPRLLLVYYLRERLGLTGTNVGCDTSNCGACTILFNGRSAKSCSILAVQADGVAPDVYTWTFAFPITHSCLLGGEVSAVGTRERTRDTGTRSGTMDFTSTRTFTDCARPIPDSAGITLNGAVSMHVPLAW